MIIAIDFDGTIVHDRFPEVGEMMEGADCCIQRLRGDGHYIIINTCRNGETLIDAINFLLEKRIPFDRVNDNHPGKTAEYGATRKVYADLYIDDHNYGHEIDWAVIEKKLVDKE